MSKNIRNRITELKEKVEEIDRLSNFDQLTNLKNKSKLEQDLKSNNPANLFLLKINQFRNLNSAFGIDAGNDVLVQTKNVLRGIMVAGQELYHFSSDEFVIVCNNVSGDVVQFARNINSYLARNPMQIEQKEFFIQFSIGIASHVQTEWMKKAVIALNKARESQFEKIVLYELNLEEEKRIQQNLFWIGKVNQALENDLFFPVFQGIRDNRNKVIEKYECLLRMKDSENLEKFISPYLFLNQGKQAGFSGKITKVMMEKCCEYFSKRGNLTFSINLTSDDLLDSDFSEYVKDTFRKYQLNGKRVTFEILESINLNEVNAFQNNLTNLKSLGAKIAVDDFGTEYSNFARIIGMDVDFIKIDGLFIKNLDTDKNSLKIVEAINSFSKSVQIPVIAEYVHNANIQNILENIDIEYSQGFLFSEPKPEILQA